MTKREDRIYGIKDGYGKQASHTRKTKIGKNNCWREERTAKIMRTERLYKEGGASTNRISHHRRNSLLRGIIPMFSDAGILLILMMHHLRI